MNSLKFLQRCRFISPKHRLEWYPPFFFMRIKVLEMDEKWNSIRLSLPLTMLSRNMGDSMFGGYQAAVADPIAAIACARQFPGYTVWTRTLSLDFEFPGNSDLELRFKFPAETKKKIQEDLARKNRSTPEFMYGLYRGDGQCCTTIKCLVAIRPAGYQKKLSTGTIRQDE
ncbi:MAG: PaaI family thioesterase [Gammaproteobacteria bacterium]